MRVAIVGGTGFLGGYIVEALLDHNHRPAVLVRPGSEQKLRAADRCDIHSGTVDSLPDLIAVLKACDAAVYNIGILRERRSRGITFEALQFEGVQRFLRAAETCGVRRLLLMSANGVKEAGTDYQSTKLRAENAAFASGMDVTVFRPSVVFGDPRGLVEFATRLHREMIVPPLPAAGFYVTKGSNKGDVMMSPLHVRDVADAVVETLERQATIGRTYTLAGPERLTFSEILRRIAAAVDRRKWIVPVPLGLMRASATLFDWIPFFPVTRDQITMLEEGNVGDANDLAALIGREPRRFEVSNLDYLKQR